MNTTASDVDSFGNLNISQRFLARRRWVDGIMRVLLFMAAAFSVFITLAIVYILLSESWVFFEHVSLFEFLTDTQWTPLFSNARYGVLPLLVATLIVAGIALLVAIPMGTILAIYLSEYSPDWLREFIKPFLELLEGVPTVVYGYFALLFVTPLLEEFIPSLSGFNMLAPGIVMGIMILPYVASVSEDAMRAVPNELRESAYGLGMNRLQTSLRVIVPASFSGITSAYVLGMSRAVGETMVVAIAAGQNPVLTFDPTESAATITAFIVQVSLGDVPHGSIAYQSIFAVGTMLFIITLIFNVIGFFLRKRFREAY